MRSFRAALAFLTTLPVPAADLSDADFAGASQWFATVGLVLGAGLALADRALRWALPDAVAAVALLALWVGVTGALHWDGLLDCLDALFAPVPPERRLDILKDVHTGAFAVVGGALALLLVAALVWELAEARRGWALLLAPIAGRWAMGEAQARWPYAREAGLGTLVRPATGRGWGAWPLLLAALGGARAVAVVVATLLLAHGLAGWMARRLGGGLTGDCYGALCEVTQMLVLLGFALW